MAKKLDMQKLLEKFLKVLRLPDWDVELTVLPKESYDKIHAKDFGYETNGCTEINDVDKRARIFIIEELDNDTKFDTLLHECVHLVTHPYDSFVRNSLMHIDSRKAKKMLSNDAMWEMEIQVSKITTILKNLLR